MDRLTAPLVEWAVASRPLDPGGSGDAYLVHPLPGGALVGVVDGLGHGPAAAEAAREAIRILADATPDRPLAALTLCHERLRTTRGVVLTLAWMDSQRDSMTWLGVGNVQGLLLGAGLRKRQETLVGRVGVVGRLLPQLHASVLSIAPGDLLVLATDGIRPGFMYPFSGDGPAQRVADDILEQHWSGADDGLVLVVRYKGGTP